MTQAIIKPELKNIEKQNTNKIIVVIPEFGYRIEKKDNETKIKKESRLFRKRKKISIDSVKSKLDAKIYYNRFSIR